MSSFPHKPQFNTLHPSSNSNPNNQGLRKLRSVQNLSSSSLAGQSPAALLAQQRQRLRNVSSFHRDHPPAGFQAPPLPIVPLESIRSGGQANQIHPTIQAQTVLAHTPSQSSAHGLEVHKSRHRAQSDAALVPVTQSGPAARKQAAAKRIISGVAGIKTATLESLLRDGPPDGDLIEGLKTLRYTVMTDRVKSDADGISNLRIYVWLILLSAPPFPTDSYLDLVHRGASPAYAKIRNDTFRTLATDPLFRRRVSEASLIRLLNAVAWRLHDTREELGAASPYARENISSPNLSHFSSPHNTSNLSSRRSISEGSDVGGSTSGIYVQGMNVLAAPFLYAARSEVEAFTAFHRFITTECPGYIQGAMDGVHRGLKLVDRLLALFDPKLCAFLTSKGMTAELYAFPSVLTLCACTPPLPEVLHLWDFLFAYGSHLNILCIVAQLILMRSEILTSPSPNKILRSFPPLRAEEIKVIAIDLVRKVPEPLYEELVNHAKLHS